MAKYQAFQLAVTPTHELLGKELEQFKNQKELRNGRIIYIYRSTKSHRIYIGQTKHFFARHAQHYDGTEQKFNDADFDQVTVLFARNFNGTALDDVEGQLITYFKADVASHAKGKKSKDSTQVMFEDEDIINGTNGNTVVEYEGRESIATDVILPFWENYLYPNGWVKTPTIDELRTQALVKYSPIKSLTDQQEDIIQILMDSPKTNFVINGDAGTGKTVLLTNLVARLITQRPDAFVAVVVQPNWIKTAKEIFDVFGLNQANLTIATSTKLIKERAKYDTVIVDEAHKLSRKGSKQMASFDEVYKIPEFAKDTNHLQIIKKIANQVVLMYDAFQCIRPANIPREQFALDTQTFTKFHLNTQFRIQADQHSDFTSDDYVNGLKYLLYKDTGLLKPGENFDPTFDRGIFSEAGSDPYFGIFSKQPLHHMVDWLDEDLNYHPEHVNRILGGLCEPWKQSDGKDPDIKHWKEDDLERRWNSTQENWVNSKDKDADEQIGSVFAVQGVDLNKAGVLIGNDLGVDEQGKLCGIRENFHNVNGKFNQDVADLPKNKFEFTLFVLNIYYVLLTRGIDGVRIGFWHNPEFADYFKETLMA